jgi:hypothetical protein
LKVTYIRGDIAVRMTITLAAVLGALSVASARDEGGARPGLIVASNVYLFPAPVDSVATLAAAMNRLQQPQAIRACCEGAWRIHFAAWLERRPGESTLELRFDLAGAAGSDGGGQRPPIFSTTVPVDPASTTAFVNDFVISKEQGFVAGSRYEVSLRRTSGLDSSTLAKGSFVLE